MTEIVNKTIINNRCRLEDLIEELQKFLDCAKASDLEALMIQPWIHSGDKLLSIDPERSDISSSITLLYRKGSKVASTTRIKVAGCRLDAGYSYDTDSLDEKINKLLTDNKIQDLNKFKMAIMNGTPKNSAILLLFFKR